MSRRSPVAPAGPNDSEPQPPSIRVSVTEIRRHLGSRIPVACKLEAEGLALTDVAVPDGTDITLAGELESIHDGVVLTATASVPWVGACRRCLTDVAGMTEVAVREIYELHPVEGETWPLDHDQVDLGPLLRDTALLALPLAPLCRTDCAGPAPEQFPAAVQGGAAAVVGAGRGDHDNDDDNEPTLDPRWAALDDLEL